ncbi:MAG: carbon-nitrogen hydrolase family protein [Caldilineaceae bacterium]|nr:carbon-nitrogen hydrolase family protein [Caldilineaceae bacterium]
MNNGALLTVAAAQYGVEFLDSWQSYADKLAYWVEEAATQGAQVLVFPEYGCLELASLFPAAIYSHLHKQLEALQELLPSYIHLHRELARRYGVYLIASSFPVRISDGGYRNRAYFCMPDGECDFQDKLMMTRFEHELWGIGAGGELKVFPTRWGPVGISICYDNEFPLIARGQIELGARVILAPSCTDTLAGYHRVRIGCQARAMENQCYVVMAPVVGAVDWSAAMDIHIGAAGIFSPVDVGFPSDGVLAQGEMNTTRWLLAELDLHALDKVRCHGQVLNHRDWDKQPRPAEQVRAPG